MARSKSGTYTIPHPIYDASVAMAKKQGYTSLNEMLVGMLRYALLADAKHSVSLEIASQPRSEQDKIDDEIAQMFKSGETVNGSWLKHLVEESVKAVAGDKEVPEHKVMRELLRRIGK